MKEILGDHHPTSLAALIIGGQFAGQIPKMLASVKQIDNLRRAREILIGQIPDPFGSITHHDLLFRPTPAALPRLQVDALAQLFRRFDRADVSSRIRIADGIALRGPCRLREGASQLALTRMRGLSCSLTLAAHSTTF